MKPDYWIFDASVYCDGCLPCPKEKAYPAFSSEADTPQHCDACGAFLEGGLTDYGMEYVREKVVAALADGRLDSVAVTEWATFYGVPTTLCAKCGELAELDWDKLHPELCEACLESVMAD